MLNRFLMALAAALCAASVSAQLPSGPTPDARATPAAPAAAEPAPQAAREPERLADPQLAEALAHCAGAFSLVANAPKDLGVSVNKEDAWALMRLTMLGTHALIGNEAGLAAVKRERAAIESKLTLTLPANQGKLMDAEFRGCVQMVDRHRQYLAGRIKAAGGK